MTKKDTLIAPTKNILCQTNKVWKSMKSSLKSYVALATEPLENNVKTN